MSCIRTGMCCQKLPLPASPRELREAYDLWSKNKTDTATLGMAARKEHPSIYTDIHLIYPMLKDRCLGKFHMPAIDPEERKRIKQYLNRKDQDQISSDEEERISAWRYVYGPCRFFERDKTTLKGICTINEIKPWMCSSYPNGYFGTFKGCGFNIKRPEVGLTFADFNKLEPLEEYEK